MRRIFHNNISPFKKKVFFLASAILVLKASFHVKSCSLLPSYRNDVTSSTIFPPNVLFVLHVLKFRLFFINHVFRLSTCNHIFLLQLCPFCLIYLIIAPLFKQNELTSLLIFNLLHYFDSTYTYVFSSFITCSTYMKILTD